MVSATEKLASSVNFGAFTKSEELKKRIFFTLIAILVYRLQKAKQRPETDFQKGASYLYRSHKPTKRMPST